MRSQARGMVAGFAGAALVLAVVVVPSGAADEKGVPKDAQDGVEKIAGLLEKGDAAGALKEAGTLKSKDLKFSMRLFKLRKNHGFGVGPKTAPLDPDGIERNIEEVAEKGLDKAALAKQGTALQQAGYRMAAIAAVAEVKAPAKDEGKKTAKNWVQWSKDMREAGVQLAEAAKKTDAPGFQKAAKAAQAACTNCHDVFRDE